MSDGSRMLFWRDAWLEGGLLCDRFRRIFHISHIQLVLVAEMYALDWG